MTKLSICSNCRNVPICKIHEDLQKYDKGDVLQVDVSVCSSKIIETINRPETSHLSMTDVIDKLRSMREPEKKLEIKAAAPENVCAICGETGTELVTCSICGKQICPDCMYDDPHDERKCYCESCYDKLPSVCL